MNSSPSPSPHPDQTADSAAPSGAEKATFSQSDMPTGAGADQSIPTAAAAVDVGATLSGYKLIQKLGEGGMGAVFIAEDLALRRKVALKTMKPELAAKAASKQRFMREARAAARIEHDNIVPIFQVGEDRGVPFLAMALLKGESLGDHLKRDSRPDVPFMLKVGRDVAAGLAAAHKQGLVHRDIKPDNIWIEPLPEGDGIRAKILDFGLARPQAEEESLVTQEGAILGTPAYMSPEQARGPPVDSRADLFSLGVVFYQMAAGKRPFSGRDTMAILTSLALDTPDEPLSLNPELPPIFSRLIMRLLEKAAEKRVQKASDVVDVLKRLQPEATVVVVAQPKPIVEVNPWEDIDASMTDVEPPPPPPPLAASRPQPVKPVRRDQTEVVHRDAASGKPRSKKPILIGGALALVGIIVAAILISGGKKSDPPSDNKDQAKQQKEEPRKKKDPPIKVAVVPSVNPTNHALSFDGKTSGVTVAGIPLTPGQPITIEARIKPRQLPPEKETYSIAGWRFLAIRQTTKHGFYFRNGPGSETGMATSDEVQTGVETHQALCFDGQNTMRLFVDGKLKQTAKMSEPIPDNTLQTADFFVGARSRTKGLPFDTYFDGEIDEVRISKVVRYETDFTPKFRFDTDADTLALYHCDEGEGDVLKDSSGNNRHGKIVGAKWVTVDGMPIAPANYALLFDVHDRVNAPTLVLDNLTQPVCIEGYFKLDRLEPNALAAGLIGYGIFSILHGSKDNAGLKAIVYFDKTNAIAWPKQPLRNGERTHLAAVRANGQIRLYVNGVQVASSKLPPQAQFASKNSFGLGPSFGGVIDEVRVSKTARYDKDFTPAKRFEPDADTLALYHFDEGQGEVLTDSSGNNHHGKIVGAKWVKVSGDRTAPRTPLPDGPAGLTTHAITFEKEIRYFDISPDGQHVVATGPGIVELREIATGRQVWRTPLPPAPQIRAARLSPDGKFFALAGHVSKKGEPTPGLLYLLRADDGTMARSVTPGGQLRSVAFSPDGTLLAAGRHDGKVELRSVATGELVRELSGHVVEVFSLAFSPDGRRLASGSIGGGLEDSTKILKLWDVATGVEVPLQSQPIKSSHVGLEYTPDGRYLLVHHNNSVSVELWDAEGKKLGLAPIPGKFGRQQRVVALPTSRYALASAEHPIVLQLPDLKIVHEYLDPKDEKITKIRATPDGRFALLLSETSEHIRLWRLPAECWAEGVAPLSPEPFNHALQFAGVGQHVGAKVPVAHDKPWTFEGWATPHKAPALSESSIIMGGSQIGVSFKDTPKKEFRWQAFAVGQEKADKEGAYQSDQPAELNKPAHLAGVFDGQLFTFFVNGVPQGKPRPFSRDPEVADFNPGPSHWGSSGGRPGFHGVLDEVRISSVARYKEPFTPAKRFESDKDTIALYHFDEGDGEDFKDSSGNNHHGKIVGAKWVKGDGTPTGALPAKFKNELGMEFALVPKGTSWLGGSAGKPGEREVEFKRDFYLGVYEVTLEEWQKVTGQNPSGAMSAKDMEPDDQKRHPVNSANWIECQEFIKLLNAKVKDEGWQYRLPTEDEWEYACRGGPMADKAQSAFDFYLDKPTNTLSRDQANARESAFKGTRVVGRYSPNRLGLFDMHGNVREWCDDEIPVDGKGPLRVSRGGCWVNGLEACRVLNRVPIAPTYRNINHGLRVARVPVGATP